MTFREYCKFDFFISYGKIDAKGLAGETPGIRERARKEKRMTEKWVVLQKRADFHALGKKFGISPVVARVIRNRDVVGDEAMERYLNGGLSELYDPHLMLCGERMAKILAERIADGARIRIIGDYDIDGVMSTYILQQGITACGGCASVRIPDRIRDGYGLNLHLIEAALADGVDTIITCDNGIAAVEEIAFAKRHGMTVLVTDHHEPPYREDGGERIYIQSEADAVVNPKQQGCPYPCKELCGAAVAFKVMQLLYERCGRPVEETFDFLEFVAFATVGDVMDLTDENRILVKEGLMRLHRTKNPGMRALILQNKLIPEQVTSYHIGFVLGPCINASGRLETARIALNLFLQTDAPSAAAIAAELVALNEQRKEMTARGVEEAKRAVEEGGAGLRVYVIYLPGVHESLAGIIAGRIRESSGHPVFVLTEGEDGIKGSGRSIEAYSMYDELCKCRECFSKFGGHPMAAGLSLARGVSVDEFREKINACSKLTEDDFVTKIKIDIAMPAEYPTAELVRELELLEPFGKGNPKPLFADRGLRIARAAVLGKNRNVLRLSLVTGQGMQVSAVYFGDIEAWKRYYGAKYGGEEVRAAFCGKENRIQMSVVYYPEINAYQGMESVQLTIRYYQ